MTVTRSVSSSASASPIPMLITPPIDASAYVLQTQTYMLMITSAFTTALHQATSQILTEGNASPDAVTFQGLLGTTNMVTQGQAGARLTVLSIAGEIILQISA